MSRQDALDFHVRKVTGSSVSRWEGSGTDGREARFQN